MHPNANEKIYTFIGAQAQGYAYMDARTGARTGEGAEPGAAPLAGEEVASAAVAAWTMIAASLVLLSWGGVTLYHLGYLPIALWPSLVALLFYCLGIDLLLGT